MTFPRAEFPHCDSNILHAPGDCVYCDKYPEKQAERVREGVRFTGSPSTPDLLPCPAELLRPLKAIEMWPGNRPHRERIAIEAVEANLDPAADPAAPIHEDVFAAIRERIKRNRAHSFWCVLSKDHSGECLPAGAGTKAIGVDPALPGGETTAITYRGREVDTKTVEVAIRMLLDAIGENLGRPGLRDTPARVARFWKSFIEYDPGTTDTTFAQEIVTDQMVVVSGMRIWSLCEHHLLPFYTDVTCGYIAEGKVLGLSKFARIAHQFGHRLQTQEQLATQIADEIQRVTGCNDVAVLCSNGQHTCMTMRGIRTEGSMSNAVMRGRFLRDHSCRTEFYHLTSKA